MAGSDDPGTRAANGGRGRRGPPCLWFTRLPLQELADEIAAVHFPRAAAARAPRVQFAAGARLVEIDEAGATLTLHQVLNQATTPVEVFGTLIKRALWRRDGRAEGPNGPAFFAICPEEPFAEAWLEHHLGECLAVRANDASDGEVEVGSKWREAWLAPRGPAPRLALARALADAELLRLLRQIGCAGAPTPARAAG